jgi:zinc-finger of transposase IS204/IS1001/IS1096/IS1165
VPQTFRAYALVPRGFVVDEITSDGGSALITVRSIETASICPGCGTRSDRVHSRYYRRSADLPIAGRPVRPMVQARRFYCRAVLCGRRVFAERFDDDVLAPWARRTARLDHILHHLGFEETPSSLIPSILLRVSRSRARPRVLASVG